MTAITFATMLMGVSALIGCKDRPDCNNAVKSVFEQARKGAPRELTHSHGDGFGVGRAVEAFFVAACTQDRWPDDLKACLVDSKDADAMNECLRTGDPEILNKLKIRMEKLRASAPAAEASQPAGKDAPPTAVPSR